MLSKIKNHYISIGLKPFLLNRKLARLEKHPDIAEEFCFWIDHREFKVENCVTVDGYTARSLSQLSEYLNGEGAFILLAELRDDPARAYDRINRGFVLK